MTHPPAQAPETIFYGLRAEISVDSPGDCSGEFGLGQQSDGNGFSSAGLRPGSTCRSAPV